MIGMLVGVSRPPWYHQLLLKLGVFKSARPHDMVVAGLGRTFQNIRLFQNMTGPRTCSSGCTRSSGRLGRRTPVHAAGPARGEGGPGKGTGFLALVSLRGRDDELAKNLPYGDQRRLEVARALASEPVLLLLDEPTAGMNPRETQQLTSLIGRLRNDLGLTVLLIEHDMRVVMGISDRVTVLDHGEKIAEDTRRGPKESQSH